MSKTDPNAYLSHCENNEIEILTSKQCRCLFCGSTFPAKDVHDWTDGGTAGSALCPVCGMPAVYGDAAGEMPGEDVCLSCQKHWVDPVEETNLPRLRTFAVNAMIGRYEKSRWNRVFDKAAFRAMNAMIQSADVEFIRYFAMVRFTNAETRDERAHWIATLKSPDFALDPLVARNRAYFELVSLQDHDDPIDPSSIYEGFSRGVGLRDVACAAGLAYCYFDGVGVKKDPDIAFEILNAHYPDAYVDFLQDVPDGVPTLAYFAGSLGICYEKGLGVKKSKDTALRYYIIGRFAAEHFAKGPFILPGACDPLPFLKKAIARLSKALRFEGTSKTLELDEYTFFDTFYDTSYYDLVALQAEVVSFDSITHTLILKTKIFRPIIAVDVNNRLADVLFGDVEWTLHDVLSVEGQGGNCDLIRFVGDDVVDFYHALPTGDEKALSIRFFVEDEPRE